MVVDRQTAFEELATGEHLAAEAQATQVALSPRPVPFTRGQIEAQSGGETSFDVVVRTYQSLRLDQPIIDALLVRRCIGEALDGFLVITLETCTGEAAPEAIGPIVQRVNRERRQLWAFMQARAKGVSEEQVRASWREKHLKMVVCGAQIQMPDGTWGIKKCEEQ